LKDATAEARTNSANFQTMLKLQMLLNQGNNLELSDNELKEPTKVLRALRSRFDPVRETYCSQWRSERGATGSTRPGAQALGAH